MNDKFGKKSSFKENLISVARNLPSVNFNCTLLSNVMFKLLNFQRHDVNEFKRTMSIRVHYFKIFN